MPNTPEPVTFGFQPASFLGRFSTILKMGSIAVLVLLLLIPLAMVESVLTERLQRRDAAVKEVTSTFGDEQVVIGPVLVVPYRYTHASWKDQVVDGRPQRVNTTESLIERAYFLPNVFKANGRLEPSRLHRGIYEAVVYTGTITLSGEFARPSFDEWNIDPQMVLWDEAEITLAATDLRGAQEALTVKAGETTVPLKPGSRLAGLTGGVYARFPGLSAQTTAIPFEISLRLNGSRGIRFAPVGGSNDVRIASVWPDPSFQGAFLPSRREVSSTGFTAQWQMSYYGRAYPQQWAQGTTITPEMFNASVFGVDLVSMMDSYRFVERSTKYGVLVIVLLFTAFFLFEVLTGARIHPFQYTLVGVALCLFYLVLLALSEVFPFAIAYWTGAALATTMISLYCVKALHGGRAGVGVAGGLVAVYGFLFVILRLQDFSLLIGTAGLVVVVSLVMYVTRNIEWYDRDVA